METPTRDIILRAINSYNQGNPETLVEVIDYLTLDCGLEMQWVVEFFYNRFSIPRVTAATMIRRAYISAHTH